jgi:hypothetical protein
LCGAREVEQMRAFGLVELKRTRQRLEHAFGRAVQVPALKPGVVVDADPGEQRNFLAAESWNAAVLAVDGQTRLVRG